MNQTEPTGKMKKRYLTNGKNVQDINSHRNNTGIYVDAEITLLFAEDGTRGASELVDWILQDSRSCYMSRSRSDLRHKYLVFAAMICSISGTLHLNALS